MNLQVDNCHEITTWQQRQVTLTNYWLTISTHWLQRLCTVVSPDAYAILIRNCILKTLY
jgi:hypothetical protein